MYGYSHLWLYHNSIVSSDTSGKSSVLDDCILFLPVEFPRSPLGKRRIFLGLLIVYARDYIFSMTTNSGIKDPDYDVENTKMLVLQVSGKK